MTDYGWHVEFGKSRRYQRRPRKWHRVGQCESKNEAPNVDIPWKRIINKKINLKHLAGRGTHVRYESLERVKQFGALVRLHRQFGLIAQWRSASREERVHQKRDEHVQDQACK